MSKKVIEVLEKALKLAKEGNFDSVAVLLDGVGTAAQLVNLQGANADTIMLGRLKMLSDDISEVARRRGEKIPNQLDA